MSSTQFNYEKLVSFPMCRNREKLRHRYDKLSYVSVFVFFINVRLCQLFCLSIRVV